jgi:anaerobic ribonucleoside-triphosphate reductase activating protein
MLQARALAALSRPLREAGLSVVCYTGWTWEDLRESADPGVAELLGQVDLLIDGPYLREQAANLRWRGSRNQRLHFLTGRYRRLAEESGAAAAEVELVVGSSSVTTMGTWPEGFLERLRTALGD